MDGSNLFDCTAEVRREYDVAIDVAKDVVLGDLLGAVKKAVDPFESAFIALHVWLVPQAELSADFRRAFIIAEENNFCVRMQQCPALQRIPLDHFGLRTAWQL